MARTRYFDYLMDDQTRYLNEKDRGMRLAGVYFGFDAVPGSSGMKVSIDMDTDPDISGNVLGKLVTASGMTIEETANLADVDTAANGHATHPRIDCLVATYTYNASLPNNDVTYEIVAGTPAASPTAPSLADNQTLIAELWIPATTATITAAMIRNVEKRSYYSTDVTTRDFTGILRKGAYTGLNLKEGTAANKLTITAGTAITGEGRKITEAADLTDELTISDNSAANNIRYDVIVALYKYGNSAPTEYLAVEGSEATYGVATPVLPSDTDILSAITAYSFEYTSLDYAVPLGYLEVYSQFAASWNVTYYQYPRQLKDIVWYVSSGIEDANFVGPEYATHWPWTGHEGLTTALSTARDLVDDYYADGQEVVTATPITILVSGKFKVPYLQSIAIPSYVKVQGIGSAEIEVPEDTNFLVGMIQGGFSQRNLLTAAQLGVSLSGDGVPQTGVSVGYERVELEIGALFAPPAILPFDDLPNGLADFNFSGDENGGDTVVVRDNAGNTYTGYFEKLTTMVVSGDWCFSAMFPTGLYPVSTDKMQMYIRKHRNAVENLRFVHDSHAAPSFHSYYSFRAGDRCTLRDVEVQDIDHDLYSTKSRFDRVLIPHGVWVSGQSSVSASLAAGSYDEVVAPGENYYDDIHIIDDWSSTDVRFCSTTTERELKVRCGSLVIDNDNGNGVITYIGGTRSTYEHIKAMCATGGVEYVAHDTYNSRIGLIDTTGCTHVMLGTYNSIGSVVSDGTDTGEFTVETSAQNVTVDHIDDNVTYSASFPYQYNYLVSQLVQDHDEDRNLSIHSDAVFSWAASTGVLTFDDDILINIPYENYYNTVQSSESPVTLSSDGDAAIVTLDRTGAANLTVTTVAKTSTASYRNMDTLILAFRSGDSVYLWDGTKLSVDSRMIGDKVTQAEQFVDALYDNTRVLHSYHNTVNMRGIAIDTDCAVMVGDDDASDPSGMFSNYGKLWRTLDFSGASAGAYDLYAIAHDQADPATLWVAVGETCAVNPLILTSPDGFTWTSSPVANAAVQDLLGIAYDVTLGLWVSVGLKTGSNPTILTSPDASTWTVRTPSAAKNRDLYSVCSIGSDGYCAVGETDATDGYILTSANGTSNWTERSNTRNLTLRGVAFDGIDRIVAVGDNDPLNSDYPYIVTSTNGGVTWGTVTAITMLAQPYAGSYTLRSVAYNKGVWVAVGSSDFTLVQGGRNSVLLMYSMDGLSWKEIPTDVYINPSTMPGANRLYSVAVSNKIMVSCGAAGSIAGYPLIVHSAGRRPR